MSNGPLHHLFQARRALTDRLAALAPDTGVIRVRPDGTVSGYGTGLREIHLAEQRQADIAGLLREHYQGIDWGRPHDYYLSNGQLRQAPADGEPGSDPAADGTFGSKPGPRLLRSTRPQAVDPS